MIGAALLEIGQVLFVQRAIERTHGDVRQRSFHQLEHPLGRARTGIAGEFVEETVVTMDDLILAIAIGVFGNDLRAIPASAIHDAPLARHHIQDRNLGAAMGAAGISGRRRIPAWCCWHPSRPWRCSGGKLLASAPSFSRFKVTDFVPGADAVMTMGAPSADGMVMARRHCRIADFPRRSGARAVFATSGPGPSCRTPEAQPG